MKVITRKFGEIEIDTHKILTMPDGLPGFEGYTKFALLEDPNTKPFCWLQSVEEPNLALVVMDPFVFMPDYSIDLKSVKLNRKWENVNEKDLAIYVVINISDKGGEKQIKANLIGPIIINVKNSEMVQVVFSDTRYSHQYNILDPE